MRVRMVSAIALTTMLGLMPGGGSGDSPSPG